MFGGADITWHFRGVNATAQSGCSVLTPGQPSSLRPVAEIAHQVMQFNTMRSLSFTWTLDRTIARADGASSEYGVLAGGAVTDDGSPCNSTLLVHKIWNGRKIGRMYLPGVPDQVVNTDGLLNANYHADAQGWLDMMYQRMNERGLFPIVLWQPTQAKRNIERFLLDRSVGKQHRRLDRARR